MKERTTFHKHERTAAAITKYSDVWKPLEYSIIQNLGCIQKCKVIANVWLWIPVPSDKRQQEQGSRAKHLLVTCTSERSQGKLKVCAARMTKIFFRSMYSYIHM